MGYVSDQGQKDFIKKACKVFENFEGKSATNEKEYMIALGKIREEAQGFGLSIDDLRSEYLKRKEIIDEANSIFTIMNSTGPKNNTDLMIRLGKIRGKAKELDIDLTTLYRKQR